MLPQRRGAESRNRRNMERSRHFSIPACANRRRWHHHWQAGSGPGPKWRAHQRSRALAARPAGCHGSDLEYALNSGIGISALSGDGQRALIETSPLGSPNDQQLWLVDLQSGSKQLITEQNFRSTAVASLSVDGHRAVFYWILQNGSPLPTSYVWDEASGQT